MDIDKFEKLLIFCKQRLPTTDALECGNFPSEEFDIRILEAISLKSFEAPKETSQKIS